MMKYYLILPAFLLIIISFILVVNAIRKQDYSCHCEYTYTDGTKSNLVYKYPNTTKDNAENWCDGFNKITILGYKCQLQ